MRIKKWSIASASILTWLVAVDAENRALAQVYSSEFTNPVNADVVLLADRPTVPAASSPTQPAVYHLSPSQASAVQLVGVSSSVSSLSTQKLHQTLVDAKNTLDASRRPRLDEARAELRQAVELLEQYVGADSTNGQNWSKFLRLPEIRELVESERPQPAKLHDLEMNMRQNYLGLEYPQFVRLRQALSRFTHAVRFTGDDDRFVGFFKQNVDKVLAKLETVPADELGDIEFDLGNLLADLHQANQSPIALQQIKNIFSSPNVRFYMNQRLVDRLVSRPVAQPSDVNENILGTQIFGQAFLDGHVSGQLVPSTDGIGLTLNLHGTMTSQSQGFNRGVVVNASSISPVLATKQIFVTDHGVSTSPAYVSTNLESTIHSLQHRSRLVLRIAQRKAAKTKPEADFIAESRLQSRIGSQFSQQVDEQVALASAQLTDFRRKPIPELNRIGIERPKLAMHSTHSDVDASTVHADVHQLAAPSACPLPRSTSALAVAQLHQSAINNALETVLAGRVIRNKDLGGYVHQIFGSVPDEVREETKAEPWSVTLDTFRPVRIVFEGGLVKIALRFARMTREDENFNRPLTVSVTYAPAFDGSRLSLTRQGEVSVTSDERGTAATVMRSFLKSKFDKSFRESIVTEPLDLKNFPQLRNMKLDLSRLAIDIDDGWLQVAIP